MSPLHSKISIFSGTYAAAQSSEADKEMWVRTVEYTSANCVEPGDAHDDLKGNPGQEAGPEPAPGPCHHHFGFWLQFCYAPTIRMDEEEQEQLHDAMWLSCRLLV